MIPWLIFTLVSIAAVAAAWALGSARGQSRALAAEARVEELRRQTQSAEEMKSRMAETFKALASDALASSSQGFLTLANEKFSALKESAAASLGEREKAIEGMIGPLGDALTAYQKEARTLEERRQNELGALGQQLSSLAGTQLTLKEETAKLVNALRSPHVRGRWGEIALRKTAELSGMSMHCDFVEQESVADGRLRPDMTVKLPAGREVVVDSKVPLMAFMEALEAKSDADREAALQRHSAHVSQHVIKLSSKEYWEQFPAAPEFVVLFIPNDSFLAAAAEKDPNLIENALIRKIVIATPTTFIALLRAVAYGWRQEALAENAQKISLLGQELSDRIATLTEHLNRVGVGLRRAVDSYNDAASSFETRLLSSARKMKDLGAGGKKDIEALGSVDQVPRRVDWIERPSESDAPELNKQ